MAPTPKRLSSQSFDGETEKPERLLIIAGERYYDQQDIRLMFHISVRTLAHWRAESIIPYLKIGKKIYYPESGLQKMKKKYTVVEIKGK